MNLQPMTPFAAGTVTASVTTSSAATALTSNACVDRQVIVTSPATSAAIAFIEFGTSASVTAAVATGIPILPGSVQTFSVGEATYVACITSTSTATVYFTSGHGV